MKPCGNLSRTVLVGIVAFLVKVFFASDPVLAQQSTTGPVPPVGIDRGIKLPTLEQVVIPGVPSYIWHHGCGPTAAGMVVGYWDGNGYPDLVPGDASNQTVAVNAMIADDSENPDCAQPDGDHYQDYSCPLDYSPDPILPDRSETGGAHSSNCIGDFMQTSWSSEDNYYGWSWFSDVAPSFTGYVNFVQPAYVPNPSSFSFDDFSFRDYVDEIDAGRPVVLLVDTDGNGYTDHFVTGIGYDISASEYGIFDTWDNSIHWFDWAPIGNPWGIYGVTTFSLTVQQPIPTLSEWGMLIMGLSILAVATVAVVRKRKTAISKAV